MALGILPENPSPYCPLPTFLYFDSNIQPVRTVLRQRGCYTKNIVHALFPYVPWKRAKKIVVCEDDDPKSLTTQRHSTCRLSVDGGLEQILTFPPLLRAFEDFCVKALCVEVRTTLHFPCSCPPSSDHRFTVREHRCRAPEQSSGVYSLELLPSQKFKQPSREM